KLQKIAEREMKTVKDWQKSTEQIKAIQEEWKTMGFSPRKDTQPVWEEFRAICTAFFNSKQEYFAEVKDEYSDNRDKKLELINKANEHKESKDWRNTSQAFVKLQKEWKKVGHAGPRNEHKLWKDFRSACDQFFNAKDAYYKNLESAFEENVKKKETFIKELEKQSLGEDPETVLQKIAEIGETFNAIGDVPSEKQRDLSQKYQKAIQKKINDLNIDDDDKPNILFKSKIQTWIDANDEDALYKEKQRLKRDLKKTEEELIQIENNLGFFANSKGADKL